jgi:hypothetical protein
MKKLPHLLIALLGLISLSSHAESNNVSVQSEVVKKLLSKFTVEAKEEAIKAGEVNPKPTFSADAGRAFFVKRRTFSKGNLSCTSCHTDNPVNEGMHVETKVLIKPLAMSANPGRFTNAEKVERNLSQHCTDLWGRDCSAQDKGDLVTYLTTVK